MTTLSAFCARPLPTSVRIELFCRLLTSLDGYLRRRQQPRQLDPHAIAVTPDDVDVGTVEPGVVVDAVGLLRVAEVVFALQPGALVNESCPGAPWVLEHIVARLRAAPGSRQDGQGHTGATPSPGGLLKALQPWRSGSVDDDEAALSALRRTDAEALVTEAARLATASGPGDAVLFALSEAVRVDDAFDDARQRLQRVAQASHTDPAALRREVHAAMVAVLNDRDVVAAARVAAVLFGPGADPQRVLEPLGTRVTMIVPVEPARTSRPAAAAAGLLVAVVVAVVVATLGRAPDPIVAAPAQRLEPLAPFSAPPPAPSSAPPPAPPSSAQTLPFAGPAIVNVWLEGCSDCMPTFAAWHGLVQSDRLPRGAPIINVAYGSERPSTRAFAQRHGVDTGLRFDVDGGLVVQRTGVGTFTTFVIDERSQIVWQGRAVDAGFAPELAARWQSVRPARSATSTSTDVEATLKQAQTAVLEGEHKRAVELLEGLLSVAPNDPRVHRNLGISYSRLRHNAKAYAHYRIYVQLNPTAPDADKVREILTGRAP